MKNQATLLIPIALVFGLAIAFAFGSRPQSNETRLQGPKIGDMAPEIAMPDANGDTITLSSLQGKIVLVDFWASWCQPCRKENPNLVRTYESFKNARFKNAREFTIYSVSLDDNKSKWQSAVAKDNLTWKHHVSDFKRWDTPSASLYGVESIPSNFLLNEKGEIIGINLRGKDLDNALKGLQ
jgi:peroxiredoxin